AVAAREAAAARGADEGAAGAAETRAAAAAAVSAAGSDAAGVATAEEGAAADGADAAVVESEDPDVLEARAEALRIEHSFAGRLGKWLEPALEPLGFDWKLGIGIIGAFAAREVFVSVLGIVYGVGEVDE